MSWVIKRRLPAHLHVQLGVADLVLHRQLQRAHHIVHAIPLRRADQTAVTGDLHQNWKGQQPPLQDITRRPSDVGSLTGMQSMCLLTSVVSAMSMLTASPCSSSLPDASAAISICTRQSHIEWVRHAKHSHDSSMHPESMLA